MIGFILGILIGFLFSCILIGGTRGDNMIEDLEREQSQVKEYGTRLIKAVEFINKFNVYESFTFPLMSTEEEFQVKSSIDYEWKKFIKEPLLKILNGVDEDESKI